ncbi:hypothetical protein HOR11_gp101 [Lactobacillus phage SA-C12]|uniref:Uncharacterized protein n=1 Tax=Lactobacillus phage SA-C12 TaxID=1755697 RepID=A0A1I9KKB7_9CAUD|nr:hypothetical protein HOR11_gp101 [Lactobacillus phage SA-C12]ALY06922.1 hypothetical protein SAC12_101 [Lactobacillus phage SA-C12]
MRYCKSSILSFKTSILSWYSSTFSSSQLIRSDSSMKSLNIIIITINRIMNVIIICQVICNNFELVGRNSIAN